METKYTYEQNCILLDAIQIAKEKYDKVENHSEFAMERLSSLNSMEKMIKTELEQQQP